VSQNFEETIQMVKFTKRKDDRDIDAIKQFLYLAPSLMFLKDYSTEERGGAYVMISREFERTHGLKKADVIGKTDHDLFPRHIADKRKQDDVHTLQFGRIVTVVDTDGTRYNGFKPTKMALIPIAVLHEIKFSYIAGMSVSPPDFRSAD